MVRILDPMKEPSRFLTVAYIMALSLIALLTYGSHQIMERALVAQKDNAVLVYTAGRQRELAQKIALYELNYERNGSLEKDKTAITNAILGFQMGHHLLTRVGDDERPMTGDMHDIYFADPYNLDKQVQNYVKAAKDYIGWQPGDNQKDRDQALKTVASQSMGLLTDGLDAADSKYQDEVQAEIEGLAHTQSMMTIYVMCILVLEAVFIFNPLVRHVRQYSRMILRLASKDALTGLNNRRSFMERGAVELNRVDRHGFPVCVVMADIDKFKNINDTYGHDVGDKVIVHFGNMFKKALRAEDVIGRIGGEEFAIILPHAPAEKGFQTIDRIRKMVEKTPVPYQKGETKATLNYTASFGMVAVNEKGLTITDLLKWADKALYQAKHGGRNRVIMGTRETLEHEDAVPQVKEKTEAPDASAKPATQTS